MPKLVDILSYIRISKQIERMQEESEKVLQIIDQIWAGMQDGSTLSSTQFRDVCLAVCSIYAAPSLHTLSQLRYDLTFDPSTELVQNFYEKLRAAENRP
jgi:hypothetical protein